MSKARHVSETPATQFLKQHKVAYTEHTYDYVDHGGAGEAARQLGLDPHAVVKTLVMEDESAKPLIVVMHGDREVSTKNLARRAGLKKVEPRKPEVAQRHSGYQSAAPRRSARARRCRCGSRPRCCNTRSSTSTAAAAATVGIDPNVLVSLLDARPVTVALE